jgi:hypothetical protein
VDCEDKAKLFKECVFPMIERPRSDGKNIVIVICVILAILFAVRWTTSTDWNKGARPSPRDKKAVASASRASRLAGGLSNNDRRLYGLGVLHIEHQHERIGTFTIGQVISDEVAREAAIRQRRAEIQKSARDAATTSGEKSDVRAVFGVLQQSAEGAAMLKGYGIEGDRLTLQVDADIWGPMSDQDKTMFKETMWKAWDVSYNQRHGTSGEHVFLEIQDLNGSQIDSYY